MQRERKREREKGETERKEKEKGERECCVGTEIRGYINHSFFKFK